MFDWFIWGLELVGVVILVAWIILPVKEVKHIIQQMRK